MRSTPRVRDDVRSTGRDWVRHLRTEGYCIIPGLLPALTLEALYNDLLPHFESSPFCAGNCYDRRTKRFSGLLRLSRHASVPVEHPLVLDVAQSILDNHGHMFQLNFTQAFKTWPGQGEQIPRRTKDLWRGLNVELECAVTAIWPFHPHRAESGAFFIWPGSHGPSTKKTNSRSQPVAMQMDPGDALLLLGSTLHGAKSNDTNIPCAGLNASYSVGWLKPLENHWLAYPPQVAQTFSAQLASLIGYPQRRPDRGPDENTPAQALLPDDMPGYYVVDDALYPAPDKAADAPQTVDDNVAKSVGARLRAAYELTNSEAEVGQLLLTGARARQISKLRLVSIETVRSQIKSVYSKAGVKSHPEFILKNRPLQTALYGPTVDSAQLEVIPTLHLRS